MKTKKTYVLNATTADDEVDLCLCLTDEGSFGWKLKIEYVDGTESPIGAIEIAPGELEDFVRTIRGASAAVETEETPTKDPVMEFMWDEFDVKITPVGKTYKDVPELITKTYDKSKNGVWSYEDAEWKKCRAKFMITDFRASDIEARAELLAELYVEGRDTSEYYFWKNNRQ